MSTDSPPKASRNWIWYFVVLGSLTLLAIVILTVFKYNQGLRRQLKQEQLEAARKLWAAKRPPDYVLTYTKKGSAPGTFIVTVRQGKVVSAIMREEDPRDHQVKTMPLEERLYRDYDMAGLFNNLEDFLRIATQKDSPKTFMTASFDPHNGQLRRFVRSVAGKHEWIEIDVEPIVPPSAPPSSRLRLRARWKEVKNTPPSASAKAASGSDST
jgi:hypothetical protein